MNRIPAIGAAIFTLATAPSALAIPYYYGYPFNGNVYFYNDHVTDLDVVILRSPAGNLLHKGIEIPGTFQDDGDLPNYLVYFNVPVGLNNFGPVYQHPVGYYDFFNDLKITFFREFRAGALEEAAAAAIDPEPTSAMIAGIGIAGLAMRRRRAAQAA